MTEKQLKEVYKFERDVIKSCTWGKSTAEVVNSQREKAGRKAGGGAQTHRL